MIDRANAAEKFNGSELVRDPAIDHWRRRRIRCFVALVVFVMLHESIPDSRGYNRFQDQLSVWLNGCGLWQRPRKLFAPNPTQVTSWVSAEISWTDQSETQWNSPQWEEATVGEKFWRFRHLNYFNRFQDPLSPLVTTDLIDYLRRSAEANRQSNGSEAKAGEPRANEQKTVAEIKLFLNASKLLIPPDGKLTNREETYEMFSIQPIGHQTFSRSP